MGANDKTQRASAIGQPVLRKEDARFLTGAGQYTDDVMNAVLDALAPVGVKRLDMPASPHRVWNAMRQAEGHA